VSTAFTLVSISRLRLPVRWPVRAMDSELGLIRSVGVEIFSAKALVDNRSGWSTIKCNTNFLMSVSVFMRVLKHVLRILSRNFVVQKGEKMIPELDIKEVLLRIANFSGLPTGRELNSAIATELRLVEEFDFADKNPGNTVNSWTSRNTIKIQPLYAWARKKGVNLHWLLTGIGNPLVEDRSEFSIPDERLQAWPFLKSIVVAAQNMDAFLLSVACERASQILQAEIARKNDA